MFAEYCGGRYLFRYVYIGNGNSYCESNRNLWSPAEDNGTQVSHALAFQVLKTMWC